MAVPRDHEAIPGGVPGRGPAAAAHRRAAFSLWGPNFQGLQGLGVTRG